MNGTINNKVDYSKIESQLQELARQNIQKQRHWLWTDKEIELIKEYYGKVSINQMTKIFKKAKSTIRYLIIELKKENNL